MNTNKAPDKIYVSIRDLQNGYTTDVCLSQEKGYSAYIRKEALMERANKELKDNVGQYHNDYDLALSSLIDKLNSM